MEAFKLPLKVIHSRNGAIGYHQLLHTESLMEKYNIAMENASEEHNIEANIKAS